MMPTSKADLHIHTVYSDGTARPAELLAHMVAMPELKIIAVTHHVAELCQ